MGAYFGDGSDRQAARKLADEASATTKVRSPSLSPFFTAELTPALDQLARVDLGGHQVGSALLHWYVHFLRIFLDSVSFSCFPPLVPY